MCRLTFLIVAVALTAAPVVAAASTFEQYLLPVTAESGTAGAFGSVWISDWTAFNSGTSDLVIYGPYCAPLLLGCNNLPAVLHPGTAQSLVVYQELPFNPGLLVYVPTESAASFATELRIRDLSRQAQSRGAEVPVVHSSQFRPVVHLLDIPADSRFRTLLRVYGSVTGTVRVRLFGTTSGTMLLDTQMALTGGFGNRPVFDPVPPFAQLGPVATAAGEAALRVQIDRVDPAGLRVWAFVSVTNNDAQEVTLVTPQPLASPRP